MEVQRQVILDRLVNASVATTSNAVLEQSDTFVFQAGELVTFDGEICSRQKSPFGEEIEGSIMATDILKILQRFPDDVLNVEAKGGELVIKGKRRSAGVKMMAEVLLPFADVPVPQKFRKMPEGLRETLVQAASVCGKDETAPKTTHVHVAPDRVEATDSYRVFRAKIKTGMGRGMLIHAQSLMNACRCKLVKMGKPKDSWVHFVTDNGMILSILCAADEYYEEEMIDRLLNVNGEEVTLPSNLAEILSRAEVMDTPSLSVGGWDSQVTITLSDNVLKVMSRKEEGWFKEAKKVQYDGPDLTFSIHPSFLKELASRTRKVVISERQIKVGVDNIEFTAALETPSEN